VNISWCERLKFLLRCFLPSFGSFGQAVSEKIFKNRPFRNKNCLWGLFVNRSGQNEQSLERTFHRCFLPTFQYIKILNHSFTYMWISHGVRGWNFYSPCQRQCELLPSHGVCRPSSVNFSHFNLLLWNLLAKWTFYMVFNVTFNNISAISISFIGGGNRSTRRKPLTCPCHWRTVYLFY
jgi:hypothetical protein